MHFSGRINVQVNNTHTVLLSSVLRYILNPFRVCVGGDFFIRMLY